MPLPTHTSTIDIEAHYTGPLTDVPALEVPIPQPVAARMIPGNPNTGHPHPTWGGHHPGGRALTQGERAALVAAGWVPGAWGADLAADGVVVDGHPLKIGVGVRSRFRLVSP